MNDLYAVLGVPRDADPAAIRKAFKTLAKELHPDVNKDPAAQDRFKAVTAAYEVLGDEQRRSLYDEFGEASLRAGFDANAARAWKARGGFPAGGPGVDPGGFGGAGFGFDDLFSGLFGRGSPEARATTTRGADVEARLGVPFIVAVRGGEIGVTVAKPAVCGACGGEGGRDRRTCPGCNGAGRRAVRQFGLTAMVQCADCGGAGHVLAEECGVCGGTGRTREPSLINVKIPAGVDTGQTLRLRAQGGAGHRGGPAGDLLLAIQVAPHPFLRRHGRDLELDLPLTLAEAIGGGTVEVPTPNGRVRVRVPQGAANGARLRVQGRGVQGPQPGDLYLVLRPVLPSVSSPEAVEAAQRLDALRGEADVRSNLVL